MELSYHTYPDKNWIDGKINNCLFSLELFDEPSEYGIDKGRISRFNMVSKSAGLVAYYDRGWNVKPTGKPKAIYLAVLNFFENFGTGKRYDKTYITEVNKIATEKNHEKIKS